jgi:hypothetical protein
MMNWKGFGRKQPWPNQETAENKKMLSWNSQCPHQNLNPALPKYKFRSLLYINLLGHFILLV